MGWLVNRETGEREIVDDTQVPDALASQKYIQPSAVAVHRVGGDTYVSPDVAKNESAYTTPTDAANVALAQGHQIRRAANSGLGSSLKALIGGGASGLTLGLANPFEEAQEFNPIESTVGQIGGALLPGLFGDEAGIATAIAKDGASTERVAGSLSSKFLYGGEVSEGAGKGLESALAGAGEHTANLKAMAALPEDLSGLDAAGLRKAEESELAQLSEADKAGRVAAKSSVVQDVKSYDAAVRDANPFIVASEGSQAAPLAKSTKAIRYAFDNEAALQRNPGKLLDALERQGQAIEKTIGERETIGVKFDAVNKKIATDLEEDLATLPDSATHVELSGKAAKRYGAYADVKIAKGGTVQVAKEDAQGFLDALKGGDVQGQGQQALGKLDGLLEANKALRAKISAAMAPTTERAALTSDRLTAIRAARDALQTPKGRSLAEEMLGGSVMGHVAGAFSGMPIIGPMLGAKAGKLASDLVFGRLGKTAAAAAERTQGAVSTFLNVAKRATPTLPVAAARVLSQTSFGAPTKGPAPKSLPDLFKARTDEIKQQTMYAPDGSVQMRPDARQAMAERLAPLRAGSPVLADRIETTAARRLTFLSSIIPRRPDIAGIPIGPDHWQPSEMQIRSWTRSLSAAEDPHGVEERLAHGLTTPEDAAAYHAIYPERAEALKQQILVELPKLQKQLPYNRRMALSIFSGVAVDPSLDPRILSELQAQFVREEGSEQGSEAPKPSPQFGSVRADVGTASQQRQGLK